MIYLSKLDIEAIANAYVEAHHLPFHSSYDAFVNETISQFQQLRADGWSFLLVPFEYKHSNRMFYHMGSKRLNVYTGGQDFLPRHPLMARFRPTKWTINTMFRAVHDVNGHGSTHAPFETFEGELEAYENHARVYSPAAQLALFGETIGQLCVHQHTGKFVKVQKCAIMYRAYERFKELQLERTK